MKKYIAMGVCVIIGHVSWAQQKEFSWLIGTWKLKDKSVYETWKPAGDLKSLSGFSFRITEGDTIAMEAISFVMKENTFHYIPDIAGDQGPVDFKISSYSPDGFVAENPLHDFPKLIRYKFIHRGGKEFIEASIEGNGKVIPYHFEKVK